MNNDVVAQKTSASAWSTGIKNALNIRVGHKISSTIPTGEYRSEHAEWWIEQDLPTDETVDDVQAALEQQLQVRFENWKERVNASRSAPVVPGAPRQPLPTQPDTTTTTMPQTSPASSTQSATSQKSEPTTQPASLKSSSSPKTQGANWVPQAKSGHYCVASELPELADALKKADKHTLVLDGYRYSLWTGSDSISRVSRWEHRGGR